MTVAEKEAPVEPIESPGWLRSEEEEFDIRQLRQEMAELKQTLQKEPALQGDYSASRAQQRIALEDTYEAESKVAPDPASRQVMRASVICTAIVAAIYLLLWSLL